MGRNDFMSSFERELCSDPDMDGILDFHELCIRGSLDLKQLQLKLYLMSLPKPF